MLASEGITLRDGKGGSATVLFAHAAALVRVSAGRRLLIADDGSELLVDATWYSSGADLIGAIDEAVPEDRWIVLAT